MITNETNPELFKRLLETDSIDRINVEHRRGSSFYGQELKELDGKLYLSNVFVFSDDYGSADEISSFEEVVKKTVMVEKKVYEPV